MVTLSFYVKPDDDFIYVYDSDGNSYEFIDRDSELIGNNSKIDTLTKLILSENEKGKENTK